MSNSFTITTLNTSNVLLVIALMLLFGALMGLLFRKIRIPQVVGYIIMGIMVGQSGARLLGLDVINALGPVNDIALSMIGFLVGAELKINVIVKRGKQFVNILLWEAITPFFTVGILSGTVYGLFTGDWLTALCMGMLLGSMSASTAPAATTDVLKENRARGPLNTTTLGLVAMDDAVALILYAVTSSIVHILMGGAGTGEGLRMLESIGGIIVQVLGSMALGLAIGWLLSLLTRCCANDEGRALSFSIGSLIAIMALAVFLPVDGILCAMAAGFFITNWAPVKTRSILHLTNKFTPPVYVLFFVLVGAKLNIWAVSGMLLVMALVYVIGRTLGKSVGSTIGARISHAPDGVRKYIPFCLLSQAGVSIGLSIQAGSDFAGTMGQQIMLIITATTFIVQLIGPICVRYAVVKSGEAGLDIDASDVKKAAKVADIVIGGNKVCSPDSKAIVRENTTVRSLGETFTETPNLNYVVKNDAGKLEGIITVEHLKDALYLKDMQDSLMADDVMDKPLATCKPEDTLDDVEAAFIETGEEALPIIGPEGEALGIVERSGIDHYIYGRVMEAQMKAEKLG
jgi:Kef-type K+ transport system membrane component KefB